MKVLPFGDTGLLIEHPDPIAFNAACRQAELADVLDVIPAANSVLIITKPGCNLGRLRAVIQRLEVQGLVSTQPEEIEISVVYDGPDLDAVADLTGLDRAAIVAAHTSRPWRVAFSGFAPGFAYLSGGDPRLAVPRHDVPRTSVPSGSVGLAGKYSGIYPRSSPGGWQLIGHTTARLWELARNPPALLQPGSAVRFREA